MKPRAYLLSMFTLSLCMAAFTIVPGRQGTALAAVQGGQQPSVEQVYPVGQTNTHPPAVQAPAQSAVQPTPPKADFISTSPDVKILFPEESDSDMDSVLSLVVVDSRSAPARVSESYLPVTMKMRDCLDRMEPEIRHFMGAAGFGNPGMAVMHYHHIARAEFDGGVVHADCRAIR